MRRILSGLVATSQLTSAQSDVSGIAEVQNFRALSVTQNSITVGFEDNDNYDTLISCHPDCNEHIAINGPGNRTFYGLDSGALYTFTAVNAAEGDRRSAAVIVNQDTVPPAPESLELSTFEILEVEIKFFGVPVPHRVETNGVLAEWEEPTEGHCDCYDAKLDPTDGIAIEPKNEEGELNEGQQSRQFIHLVPGKAYDVSVWGKTCGNGQITSLESPRLENTIVIPPEGPGKARLGGRNNDFVKLCFKGPAEGYFTGFEFDWQNSHGEKGSDYLQVNDEDDTYNYRNDNRSYCHTITNLRSCTKYTFEIYTTHHNTRSADKTTYRVETLPQAPSGIRLINYDSDSVQLSWEGSEESRGYLVNVKPDGHNVTVSLPSYRIDGLQPGQRNNFEIQSYCILEGERRGQPVEYKLWSKKAIHAQATLPEPPAGVTASCSVGASSVDMNREDSSFFNARLNQEIIMNLEWDVPETGHWDGFVVTYSPFITAPEDPNYLPPFTYGAGTTSARINLPRTDQKYTVYVRSISDNIESEAHAITLTCGEPSSGPKQCLPKTPKLANVNLGQKNVEINLDHLAMDDSIWGNLFTADDPMTPQLEFRGGNGHTSKTVIIRSDNINCDAIECNSLKLNFNVCTAGFGCESRFVAAACPCRNPDSQASFPISPLADPIPSLGGRSRPKPAHVQGDSCCGDESYSSQDQSCCHDQLYERDGDENCCGSQKYNKKMFKCCGSEKGWGIATLEGSCDEDSLVLPEKPRSWMDASWGSK